MSLRNSLLGVVAGRARKEDDGEWRVGSRYEVIQKADLYDNPKLTGPKVRTVKPKDVILLLKHQVSSGEVVGLVLSSGGGRVAAWLPLEAARQQRLAESWEMKARYRVRHPATLRQDVSLTSDVVGEVVPGQEVLTHELGLHVDPDDPAQTRLRLKVSVDNGDVVGWLSPETGVGDKLLDPLNMLGMDAVTVHRTSVNNNSPQAGVLKRFSQASVDGSRARSSKDVERITPWEIGGQYRVLEKVPLMERAAAKGKRTGGLLVGAVVTITEIRVLDDDHLGFCPFAHVEATSGDGKHKLKPKDRCAGKDGRNHIDTRDQLEFEKVNNKLRAAQAAKAAQKKVQISQQPPQERRLETSNEEDEDASYGSDEEDWDDYYETGDSEEMSEDESLEEHSHHEEEPPERQLDPTMVEPKLPTGAEKAAEKHTSPEVVQAEQARKEREFAKKLQAMEIGAKEDKKVDDKTIVVDEKRICCNCGA